MRKLTLFAAILLLSSLWVVAQTSPSSSSGSSQASSSAGETTIEGCLSGSGGNWTLTDSSGKTYQLQGDTSKLSDQVGHQVSIKGSAMGGAASAGSNPAGGTSANPSSSAASTAGGAGSAIQFNVSSVKKVSDSCASK